MKNKFRKIIISAALVLVLLFGQRFSLRKEGTESFVNADAFTQTSETLVNPDRGFYKAVGISLTGEESGEPLMSANVMQSILMQVDGCSLLHLRIDLAAFSSNGEYETDSGTRKGKTQPIPSGTLRSLENTFEEIRKINGTAIVRFSYNQRGLNNENGYLNAEPDTTSAIPTIKGHITQLGGVLVNFQDVISSIETGMIGPWGEQHSTRLASIKDARTLYYNLIETWLSCGIDGVNFTVRRPLYYRYWANTKYDLSLTDSNMNISPSLIKSHPDLARVGVFNDAYLGSKSDMGTYTDRANETAWLHTAAQTTLFGGETVVDTETGGIGAYNNAAYAIYESRIVRASYLHRNWNERVIGSQTGEDEEDCWESVAYASLKEELTGLGVPYDSLYAEKTAYEYIADHMGYRLTAQSASAYVKEDKIAVEFSLKNVGFGNVVKAQKSQLLFVKNGQLIAYMPIAFDVRTVNPNAVKKYTAEIEIPVSLQADGTYDVYLKLGSAYDKTLEKGVGTALRTIAFANANTYNAEWGANRLCTFSWKNTPPTQPPVSYCQSKNLTSSNYNQLALSADENGVTSATVATDGAVSAYLEKELLFHTAESYPYICISYESEEDFTLSVYYDTGMNCIKYKQILPKGRHVAVYKTENDIKTLRLYVAHGQSNVSGLTIKFHAVQVSSDCVLGEQKADGKKLVCYTDTTNAAFAAWERLTAENGSIYTPYYIRIRTQGVSLRLSERERTFGIRYETQIESAEYIRLQAAFGQENITTGTLIVPTSYLNNIDTISLSAIETYCKTQGVTLANIVNNGWKKERTTNATYGYYGTLTNIKEKNYDREFTGIGYVSVKVQDKTFTVLADSEAAAGTLRTLANAWLADTSQFNSLPEKTQALLRKYAA